jgi:hypothetical protein
MRPLATWLVVGALAVIALFAARDALQGREAAPASHPVQQSDRRVQSPPGFAGPPRIDRRFRLSKELRRLGARGVLYLTDANCRRFLLRLPGLVWTTPQGLPGPDCTSGVQPVEDGRFGVVAEHVSADVIEARVEDWHLRFEGSGPAFTPEGTLTFIRGGRLYEWTVRCPPGSQTASFRGLRTLKRCPRLIAGAPQHLRELVWLDGRDFAAVAGEEFYSSLLVVRGGRARMLFRAIGVHMGSLKASPGGRYVAAWVAGGLAVFDTRTGRPILLPAGADHGTRAIAWSPDDRYTVVASVYALHLYRASHAENLVTLPLAAVGVEWR